MTQTIRAAHNLSIELAPERWRLLNGAREGESPTPLVDITVQGITCSPAFTRVRQVPQAGKLSPPDVARVVVGWAPESENWHLGLLLAVQPGSGQKSRWCGLASWPSGDPAACLADAKWAGQALAHLIDRPFHLIPPPSVPQSVAQWVAQPPHPAPSVAQPAPQPVPQAGTAPVSIDTQPLDYTAPMQPMRVAPVPEPLVQSPPFTFEDVVMQTTARGYVWKQRGRWLAGSAVRTVGLAVLAVLFAVLSLGTQSSGLASVQPGWLPALGLVVAATLLFSSLRACWALLTVSHVVLDTARGEVRRQSRFTGRTRWRVPFGAVTYVLVSQSPAHPQGHKHVDDPMRITQDVWLHVCDGHRFLPVAALERVEGRSARWEVVRTRQKKQGRRQLRLADYDTPAHHAARIMAETIGTDVWLDIR